MRPSCWDSPTTARRCGLGCPQGRLDTVVRRPHSHCSIALRRKTNGTASIPSVGATQMLSLSTDWQHGLSTSFVSWRWIPRERAYLALQFTCFLGISTRRD